MTPENTEIDLSEKFVSACDVPGCGRPSFMVTTGKEVEKEVEKNLKRPSVPYINVCNHHSNWPHSEDAHRVRLGKVENGTPLGNFAREYRSRVALMSKLSQGK